MDGSHVIGDSTFWRCGIVYDLRVGRGICLIAEAEREDAVIIL